MELLQLKYFCDAAESENFSVTAKKFAVPPSGISQTIKRLEEELSVKLFERRANRILLSEQGKIFYDGIKRGIGSIENAKNAILDTNEELSGEIKISVFTNRRIVTRAIEKFRAEYKNVNLVINHNIEGDIKNFDLIIADEELVGEGFEKTLLVNENIVLAMDRQNPLAKKYSIKAVDLKGQRFIAMPKGSSLYTQTKRICALGGFSANIVIQTDDPFYVRKYVEMGLGIAFVPEFSWKGLFSDKVILRGIGNFKRNICIFRPSERYYSKAAQLFSKMLLDLVAEAKEESYEGGNL